MSAVPSAPPGFFPSRLPLPYLLLAVALHALVLLNLPAQRTAASAPPQPLQGQWHRSPIFSPPSTLAASAGQPARRWLGSAMPAAPAPQPLVPHPPTAEPPPNNGHLLADQARAQIRQDSRQQSAYRQAHTLGFLETASREIPTALGQAMHKAAPGEKRLANGIIQVSTAAGTTYCLQASSELRQRDTPMPLTVVPSTCP